MKKVVGTMGPFIRSGVLVSALVGMIASGGCIHRAFSDEPRADNYTGSLFYNPRDAFPIEVQQSELAMSIPVGSRDRGLSDAKRSELVSFLHYYKDQGNGRVKVAMPHGAKRSQALRRVLSDVQKEMEGMGFGPEVVKVARYSAGGDPYPVIQLSFNRHVAVAPECGDFNENYNQSENNWNSRNWGCSTQNNLAAMIANPRDLKGPRGWSPRDSRRRDYIWDKFVKGEPSGADRSAYEKVEATSNQ